MGPSRSPEVSSSPVRCDSEPGSLHRCSGSLPGFRGPSGPCFCCLLLIEPIHSLFSLLPCPRPLCGHPWVCLTHTCGDGSSIRATANVLGPRRPPFGSSTYSITSFSLHLYQLQLLVTVSASVSVGSSTAYCLPPTAHTSSPFANVENDTFLFQ